MAKPPETLTAMQWWERRRLIYNLALLSSIVLGYVAYVIVVTIYADTIGAPVLYSDGTVVATNNIDFGGVALIGACCGASIGLLLANICYFLGAGLEGFITSEWRERYRKRAWWGGLAFSCFLPFSIALLHLTMCIFFPNSYDRTPIVLPDITTQPTSQPNHL